MQTTENLQELSCCQNKTGNSKGFIEKTESEDVSKKSCCCSEIEELASPTNIKAVVQEKYSQVITTRSCGCSPKRSDKLVEGYDKLEGYIQSADYGLGCGIPTEYADIEHGHIVLDLGSGAGNDVFVASAMVGESGYVIGIDFTDK